ncbi:oligosaccharide flippase family protein [Thalassotalea sediminis]|uniref:oligosaccharide flippase family protein n=1 Tax=Thalassotalea sediminis TaxID=1759089 RepID=UPI00257465F6|nr:oligosaccharide flippase family protein [Thalassotalea sediminis]
MRTIIQTSFAAVNLYSEYFLGLLVSIIIARNLTTEEYGAYSSAIWIAGLITIAINSGLSITVTKFVSEFKSKSEEQLKELLGYTGRLLLSRILIVMIIFIGLIFLGAILSKFPMWLSLLLVTSAMFKAYYIYQTSIFKGLQRFEVLAKTSLIANPINLTAVIICSMWFSTIESFLMAYCIACIAFAFSILRFNKLIPAFSISKNTVFEHKKRVLTQVLSATAIVFFGAITFRQSQSIVLEQSGFLSAAGYFNLAFILATAAITLIPGIYQEILLPKLTRAIAEDNVERNILQAQRYLLILSSFVLFPVLIYAENIIDFLYGEKYLEAAFALRVIIIFRVLVVINNGANLTLISQDKQLSMAKVHTLLVIITLILSFFLTPKYGINGALVVYGSLSLILIFCFYGLAAKIGYHFLPILNVLKILISALLASTPAIFINLHLTGLAALFLGSVVFAIIFLHLLLLTRGYDDSVVFLFKQLRSKAPKYLKPYFNWCVKMTS